MRFSGTDRDKVEAICNHYGRDISKIRGHEGGNWRMQCPVHNDNNPSCYIRFTNDDEYGLKINCFACRDNKELYKKAIEALKSFDTKAPIVSKGYKQKAVKWINTGEKYAGMNVKKIWNYKNKDGGLIFQKLKGETGERIKDFRIYPSGQKMVFYNLNDLRFNKEDNECKKPVYITEGEKDAETIEGLGLGVVVTTSPIGEHRFESHGEELGGFDYIQGCDVVIFEDNDEAGKNGAKELAKRLFGVAKDIKIITFADFVGEKGDVTDYIGGENGATQHSKDDLIELIQGTPSFEILEKPELIKAPDNILSYAERDFLDLISTGEQDIATGFKALDDKLGGGLRQGLYIIGANSGVGKTTFCVQMADQIAIGGNHILFFSLEMSKAELISKIIARRLALKGYKYKKRYITGLDIIKGETNNPQFYKDRIFDQIVDVNEDIYDDYKFAFSIVEIGTEAKDDFEYIKDKVGKYINANKVRPVVIIDYLQIMQNEKSKSSAKDGIDNTVLKLKRLSREYNIPVIVISSLNRASYLNQISYESFKESGGIEYTADVLLGLQYKVLDETKKLTDLNKRREEIKEAKVKIPRELQLVAIKNRRGVSNFAIDYKYNPICDLFTEENQEQDDEEAWRSFGGNVVYF